MDRLRPQNLDELLSCWMLLGRFGAMHWRQRNGGKKAHPCISDSLVAHHASAWARSAYEQYPLQWVNLMARAAGTNIVKVYSGEDNWMVHNNLTDMPHIPLDRVLLGWKLRSTVKAWDTNIGELVEAWDTNI